MRLAICCLKKLVTIYPQNKFTIRVLKSWDPDEAQHMFGPTLGSIFLQIHLGAIGTASANSAKFRGIRPRMYVKDLL